MKIGHFITHFPYRNQFTNISKYTGKYHCGGGEIAAYELINELSKRGHDITVFTTSKDLMNSKESIERVSVFRHGRSFRVARTSVSIPLLFKPLKYDVDIVHIHNTTPPGVIAGVIYAIRKNKPLVITHHGAEKFSNYGSLIRRIVVYIYVNYIVDKIFRFADMIISPSKQYVEESRYLRKYRGKLCIIPNGINLEDYDVIFSKEEARKMLNLSIKKKIVLFLGNLIPKKGPHILLKAMEKVINKIPDVMLVIVGNGPMKGTLEKATNLGLKDFVRFAGYVDENEKKQYYLASDIFCLPSILATEVFPLTLLEASASGLPLVVSNLKTFKCIIEEGYNGVFAENNHEDLANKLIYLLECKKLRERMGNNARNRAKQFSWIKIAQKTAIYYQDLIDSDK